MVDYKEIPELIRAFLAASDANGQRGWNDETADLAESYITLVKEANDRLRRCAEYLHRGMRSEAVHLAECQPRLLELAEALRLPDPVVSDAAPAWPTAFLRRRSCSPTGSRKSRRRLESSDLSNLCSHATGCWRSPSRR